MESKGLITRDIDNKKKNQVIISLTEKGKQTYCNAIKSEVLQMVMSNLSEQQLSELQSHLQVLMDYARITLGEDNRPIFPTNEE